MKTKKMDVKNNCLVTICIALLLISIGLKTQNTYSKEANYEISYEYINIKDMAQANVATKISSPSLWEQIFENVTNNAFTYNQKKINNLEAVELQATELPVTEPPVENKPVWRLPTEMGRISQYPHYGHAAYDITSPRGTGEYIFPVANGIVTGVYYDNAGALVVAVLHEVDGARYTSLYAHLSSFAEGLHVGQEVTVNDSLGRMGSTGYSTGVHLHFVLTDCALFDPNDRSCSNLGSFFNYTNARTTEGYFGLGNHIVVPDSWNSR